MEAGTPQAPTSPETDPSTTGKEASPQVSINLTPEIASVLASLSKKGGSRIGGNSRLGLGANPLTDPTATLSPEASSIIFDTIQGYRDNHPAIDPDPLNPTQPPVNNEYPLWPKIIVDHSAEPLPDPNKLPMPTGPLPFDKLAFGGIRKWLFTRRFLEKPAEQLNDAKQDQNFYRSLANEALVKVGVKVFPVELEPVTIYDPDNPVVSPKGLKQHRTHREVMGHKNWVRRWRNTPGIVDELANSRRTRIDIDKSVVRLTNILSDREDKRSPRYEQRQAMLHDLKRVFNLEVKDLDSQLASGAISQDEYDKQREAARKHYKKRQEDAFVEYPYITVTEEPITNHSDKVRGQERRSTKQILRKAETGFGARRRKERITKLEKKIENNRDDMVLDDDGNIIAVTPGKAQRKINRLNNIVQRTEKRKAAYKKARSFAWQNTKKAVKSPVTLGAKLNQARKNRKTTTTPPTTP